MNRKLYILFLLTVLFCVPNYSHAQKFGFIDTDAIMQKMPEYKKTQGELKQLTQKWQKEVQAEKKKYTDMFLKFEAQKILLTPNLQKERQEELEKQFAKVQEVQEKYFGMDGMLYIKRYQLMKPVYEAINKAAQTVAKKKRLRFIFDKKADYIIYANEVDNYTDYVLLELGISDEEDTLKDD